MEIKNSKMRKSFLVAGIVFGVAGWSFLAYAYKNYATDKEEPVGEISQFAEQTQVRDNPNLNSSVEAFLTKWISDKGNPLKAIITDNFDSVTGYYAYPVNVTELGKTVKLDLGLSQVEVLQQNITAYTGFLDSVTNLKKDANGLAIVKYDNNNISSVEVYQLDQKFSEIQNAILKADLEVEEDKTDVKKKEKTYAELTADDWKGMTLLASRDITSKGMAPIFVVPNTSLKAKSGDFEGTFYYIVAGTLQKTSQGETTLKSYEGKTVHLDFGVDSISEDQLGEPVWMHVVAQEGNIKNIEIQSFEGADIKTMSEGMIAFISTASLAEDTK